MRVLSAPLVRMWFTWLVSTFSISEGGRSSINRKALGSSSLQCRQIKTSGMARNSLHFHFCFQSVNELRFEGDKTGIEFHAAPYTTEVAFTFIRTVRES